MTQCLFEKLSLPLGSKLHATSHLRRTVPGSTFSGSTWVAGVFRRSTLQDGCLGRPHLIPTSLAKTNLALPCSPDSSGYARSFRWRAPRTAAPSSLAHRTCGVAVPASRVRQELCSAQQPVRQWECGRTFVTIWRRRASTWFIGHRSFVVTLGSGFTTHARCTLQREPSTSQHPCICAKCLVVAKDIKVTAAPAEARGRGINPRQRRRWEAREGNARQRASCSAEHRLFRKRKL